MLTLRALVDILFVKTVCFQCVFTKPLCNLKKKKTNLRRQKSKSLNLKMLNWSGLVWFEKT